MKTYQLVEVWFYSRLYLTCTHEKVIDDLLSVIQKQIPSAQVSIYASPTVRPYKIDNLKNLDYEIYELTLLWLCEQSFEPYAVYPFEANVGMIKGPPIRPHVVHCFRREIQRP